MATAQTELTTAHGDLTTEQTDLIEKLTCLELETSQLNLAYRLWRSHVEQATPGWMAAAIRVTYDALITFYLEVSTILADGTHGFSATPAPQLKATACETSGIWVEESATGERSPDLLPMTEPERSEQIEFPTEQTELIEKLNCLEFETSQLNRAYQLWRSCIEQGAAPDWMAAAIGITYDALIKFYLDVSTIHAEVPHAFSAWQLAQSEAAPYEISSILEEEIATVERSPESLAMTEPDWSEPDVSAVISPPSTADTMSDQPAIEQGQQEGQEEEEAAVPQAFSARYVAHPLEAADCEIAEEESTIAEPSPELLPMTEPDWSEPELPTATSLLSTADAMPEEPDIQPDQQEEEEAAVPHAFSARYVAHQLEAADCEIAEEESTIAESSPELLAMTERDWSEPEWPSAISPLSTADTISEQPAIHQSQREEEAGVVSAVIHIPATLATWMQRSPTSMLFLAPFVAVLIVAGGAMGIYLATAHAAPNILSVQTSPAQVTAGAIAIPIGNKAEFKFDPDPVVAPLGHSFVLNAVLSRGSDITSVAVQIDYDADLLQFMGVSQGGFLAKDGKQVVLAQRNDPLTGVVRISAEKPPGNPGISGDGQVFALSFQARKRGLATVSIVPGAHDSQGRRIEMMGAQVSVRVN